MFRLPRSTVSLLALTALATGLLAGCGDDGDPTPGAAADGVGNASSCAVADLTGSYLYEIHGDLQVAEGFVPYLEVGLLVADGEGGVTRTGTNSVDLTEASEDVTFTVAENCVGEFTFADGSAYRVSMSPGGQELTFFAAGSDSAQAYLDGSADRVTSDTEAACDDEVLSGTYQYRARGVFGGQPHVEHGFEVYDGTGAVENVYLVAGQDERTSQAGTFSFRDGCHAVVEYDSGQTLDQYVAPDGSEFYWIQTAGFDAPGFFGGHEHRVSTAVDTALTAD